MANLLTLLTRTSIVLSAFLVPLVFSPWTFEAFEFSKQYLFIFLVLIGLFSWLAKMILIEREVHFKRTPLDLPIFLFALVAIFSTLFSVDSWSSLFGYYGRFSDGLLSSLAGIGLYLLITNTVKNPTSLLRPFLLSGAISLLVGYLSFFGALQQIPQLPSIAQQIGFTVVAQSVEGFSIFLAFFISFVALLLLRPVKEVPWAGSFLLLFSAFGLLLLVDVSKAWFLLLIGLVLVLIAGLFQKALTGEERKISRLWLPVILLLVTTIFVFSPTNVLSGLPEQLPKEPMLGQKTSMNVALGTITTNAKSLLLGSGPGTFAIDFTAHKPADFNTGPQWQARFDRPSNHVSEVLATKGILGFLSYLGLVFWFLLISFFFVKDRKHFPFVLGAVVLVAGHFVYYQITVLQVLFWLFLALSVLSFDIPQREFRFSLRKFLEFDVVAKAVLLLFLGGVGVTFFFGARFFEADMKYLSALSIQTTQSDLRIERAGEAVLLNPWQAEYKMFLSRLYLGRVLGELQKPDSVRDQEQLSNDVQLAIAYSRGDVIEGVKIVGATELSPNRVATWETLGAVYRDITFAPGATEWGVRSFEKAIALEPESPVLYTELGKLEVIKEDYAKAKEHFLKAQSLKGDYIDAQLQLALLKEKEGDSAGATASLRELSLRYSLDIEARFQLGRLLYNNGKVTEAILEFEQVLEVSPNNSNALFALGVAYESDGNLEKAIETFERVFELNPENKVIEEKLQGLKQ